MKTLTNTIKTIFVTSLVLLFGIGVNVHASIFEEVTFEFEDYGVTDLGWVDSADDGYTGSTALGFPVTIGGATYSYFDMGANGDIELLTDAGDVPTGHGYDSISGLISWDSSSTYLLAAYDDLSSEAYGYFGYKLFSDRAVFYYDTETWEDSYFDILNNFEVVLYDDGNVQWNFNYANYESFDYDLFSGLYFGNTETLLELTSYDIPSESSYLAPEPSSLFLLGLSGLALLRKRRT
jgi:hypothetical protein